MPKVLTTKRSIQRSCHVSAMLAKAIRRSLIAKRPRFDVLLSLNLSFFKCIGHGRLRETLERCCCLTGIGRRRARSLYAARHRKTITETQLQRGSIVLQPLNAPEYRLSHLISQNPPAGPGRPWNAIGRRTDCSVAMADRFESITPRLPLHTSQLCIFIPFSYC